MLRAIALLRRNAGDRASALRDYQRAHAIYIDLRARGYGGAYAASELGSTKLELGDLESESGHAEEACRWYRQSAALFDELAARGALRSDSHVEAGEVPPRGWRPAGHVTVREFALVLRLTL